MTASLKRLFLLTSIGFLVLSQSAKAQEVLKEYLFEGGPNYLANWGAGFKGAYKAAPAFKEPFTVSLDNMESRESGGSLRVEIQQDSGGLIRVHSPGIAVPPGNEGVKIQIRAFVKTEGLAPGSVGFGILEKTTDGKPVGYIGGKERLLVLEENYADWHEVTIEGKLNGTTTNAIFMMTIEAQPTAGSLLLSNMVVEIFP
jgi:hypothetical protein